MAGLVSMADLAYLCRPVLPRRWMYVLARWHGRVRYWRQPKEAETVRRNLTTILGDNKSPGEIVTLTRQFFEYQEIRSLMLAIAPGMSHEQMAEMVPVDGIEHLDAALDQGKGVILLASHLNSVCVFVVVMMLRRRGYDVRVALPTKVDAWAPTLLRRVVNRLSGEATMRELIGGFYGQFNIRPIVRSLGENAVVLQTGDGWHSARFVEVEFLGRLLPFATGMFGVAQLTGAPVVPVFGVGAPPDELCFIMEEPFTVDNGPQGEEDLRARVTAYVNRLERHVLENMACWQHWLIEDTLDTMAQWTHQSLATRYSVES